MASRLVPFEVHRLGPVLGARVEGLDLAQPPDAATAARVREALWEHGVLVFPKQCLDPEQQVRVASIFGEISQQGDNAAKAGRYGHISNDSKVGFAGEGELRFHADHCFYAEPLRVLMLYALELPSEGGDTLFADQRAAWDRLPPALKERVRGLVARHAYDYTMGRGRFRAGVEEIPETAVWADHPVAMTHPESHRTLLYVNRDLTYGILGLSPEESAALLDELIGYVNDPAIVYGHKWQLQDLVVWDNIALQHARTTFDPQYKRTLRRVQIT